MLPQNNISGLSIAWGRAKWGEIDGEEGYVFDEPDSFQITVTPQHLEKCGVSEDDLMDCVDQIEDEMGDPEKYRPHIGTDMGLFPKSGYSNVGIVIKSRSNDKVTCVFTPTSVVYGEADGYFEWYYDESNMNGYDSLGKFLSDFDKVAGDRTANIMTSPIVPSYMEASELSVGLNDVERDRFLTNVWNYHKNVSKGYKQRLEQEILNVCNILHEDVKSLTEAVVHKKG